MIYRYALSGRSLFRSRPSATIVHWQPRLYRLKPPDKAWKYSVYTIFHWFRVFRNANYGALFALENGAPKASMLIVPAYFRWPFMNDGDVQFTYVVTHSSARREGWAELLLHEGIRRVQKDGRQIWYVTDSNNVASQRLAEKTGFELIGTAEPRRSRWSRVRLSEEVEGQPG